MLKTWAWEGVKSSPAFLFFWVALPCAVLLLCLLLGNALAKALGSAGRKAMSSAPVEGFMSRAEARELDRVARKAGKAEARSRARL